MPQYEWFEHLEGCIPPSVSGDKLSVYAVALEGWRRGLDLKFYNVRLKGSNKLVVRYSLSNGNKTVNFIGATGSDVTKEARRICKSKNLTKKNLMKSNVPVPIGKGFDGSVNYETILQYADSIGYPVVLKPSNGKMGKGVIPNIVNKKELVNALKLVREKLGYSEVILEQHKNGKEYRVYVINGEVIGAINRLPAYIIGNGKDTIRKLIKQKNTQRRKIPSLRMRPIKFDKEVVKYVKQSNYTFDTILEKGEYLVLRKNSNVSSGGEPVDVTDLLTNKIKNIAINASKAIPGLNQCGVDIIVDEDENNGVVIELNTTPGIGSHLYPLKGKARDIPKNIIDYYFPNNTREEMFLSQIYFDYTKINNLLKNGETKDITLSRLTNYDQFIKKAYKVFLKGEVENYRSWVMKRALNYELSGQIIIEEGYLMVVIGGNKSNVDEFIKLIFGSSSFSKKITSTKEINWEGPILNGFRIIKKDKKETDSPESIPEKKNENKFLRILRNVYK